MQLATRRLIIQLSDIHLTEGDELRSGFRPLVNLQAALAAVEELDRSPDALLFTGDLTDAGDPSGYRELRALAEQSAQRLGAEVIYVPGNHDARAPFRDVLLDEPPNDDPIDACYWIGGLRIAALDSTIPGIDQGELRPDQLERLGSTLSEPAPEGTILVLHHPPISSPIEQMAGLALRQPEQLEAALEGSDVFAILCGHNHHATSGRLGPYPVHVAPATAYRADARIEGRFVPVPGCGFSRIDIENGSALVTYVPVALAN